MSYLSDLEQLAMELGGHDFETSNYGPVKEFIQQHGAFLAGPVDAPSNSAFTLEPRNAERPGSYHMAYGVMETVVPHFGGGLATIAGHGVMQVRFGGSESGFGSDVLSTPAPGVAGLFAIEPDSSIATFICCMSPINIDNTSEFSDSIVQGSGVGVHASPQHNAYISALVDSGGILPFAGDRPYDAIAGDYDCTNTAGVALHIDTELSCLSASEICGVFIFRESGLLRVAGESLEIEGESFIRQSGDFNRELSDIEQRFIYPWEVLGSLSVDASQEIESYGSDALFDGVYAAHEPKDASTVSIARMDVLGGYLGQGWQETVSVPLENGDPRGVQRSQRLLDGTYMVETAAGAIIAKTYDVPVLRRTEHPEVLLDGKAYRFSGQIPDGENPEEHVVRSLIGDAVSADDYYAYVSRWQSTHAGHYHPHVDVGMNGVMSAISDARWDTSDKIEVPEESLKIDDRYGATTIKQILSLFAIMPNGDIVLKNSQGAELRLSGGKVSIGGASFEVDCARNVTMFADRISLRSYADTEVVASQGSVRVKAERNVLVLGGNGGRGGILIESRGSGLTSDWTRDPKEAVASGVVIKSATSHVSIYGGQILCKTGGGSNSLASGNIVLDCDRNRVMLLGAELQRHTTGELRDFFKSSGGQIVGLNTYSTQQTVVSGDLRVPGNALIGNEVQAVGNLRSSKGHVYTDQAPQFEFKVEKERNGAQIDSSVQIMHDTKQDKIERETAEFAALVDLYAGRNKPLNATTIVRSSFGFPSSESYGTKDAKFRRAEWHGTFASGASWDEPIVKYQTRYDTRPYPGNTTWLSTESLLIPSESVLIDQATGQPRVIVEDDAASKKVYEDFGTTEPKYGSFQSDFKREKQ